MLTRRAFLAAGASALTIARSQNDARAQGRVVLRRSVRGMAANDPDLAAMRRAVAAMRALPASDRRNWTRFANIHRDFCPHGNWYFLPWHRAYIVSFERVVRELSGKADFALPYWDWSSQRQLPAPFAAGTPRSNPLNHPRPGFSEDASLPDDMVGREVMARILASPDFEAFGSTRPRGQNGTGAEWQRRPGTRTELEFNPHDGVHTRLGGDMARPSLASRDPIFFLHHANVDRIWSMWNRRGNDNSNEPMWLDFAFNRQFVGSDGAFWNVSVEDLLSPAALGYRYEGETIGYEGAAAQDAFAADPVVVHEHMQPIPPPDTALNGRLSAYRRLPEDVLPRSTRELQRIALASGGAVEMAAAENDQIASRDRPIGVTVPLGRPLAEVMQASAGAGAPQRRIWAVIRDIEPPADNTTRVRVFVNCGELSPSTPVTHPTYATSLSFFGTEHGDHGDHGGNHGGHRQGHHAGHQAHAQHGGMTSSALVDLTPTLARMGRTTGIVGDRIVVQLVPAGGNGASRVRPRRVEVAVI